MQELERARAEIDRIDAELARLFTARMAAAAELAAVKQAAGLPTRDPAREQELLRRGAERIDAPALRPYFAAFQRHLMGLSRAYQDSLREDAPAWSAEPGAGPALVLERGGLQNARRVLPRQGRVFLLTDTGVPSAYVRSLAAQCPGCVVYRVRQGEQSKSPAVLTAVLEAMLQAGLTRKDAVAALGGGVVCDLAGLAAGLYLRGIDCCYFPSTLLAMADAAVGGKTAIDLGGVKNAVGLFRQPRAVVIDPELLATLPPRQLANGMAEAVKMALTHDAALFARLEDPADELPVQELIAACLRIKTAVVAADEKEAGLRRVLNFGHTLGHGIEAAAKGSLLHGECVGLGMLPMCAPPLRARLRRVLKRLGLPTYVNLQELDPEAVMAAIAHDKKAEAERLVTVYVPEPGRYEFRSLSLAELRARLLTLKEED